MDQNRNKDYSKRMQQQEAMNEALLDSEFREVGKEEQEARNKRRPAISRVIAAQAKKTVHLDYTALTKMQLYYLFCHSAGAKLPEMCHRPNLPDEVFASLAGNPGMSLTIHAHFIQKTDALVPTVTPFTYHEAIAELPVAIVRVSKSSEGCGDKDVPVDEVTISQKVVDVPYVNGIPVTMKLKNVSPHVPVGRFDMVVANTAYAVGSLTERKVDGSIVPAVGTLGIAKLKIPYITNLGVLSLCQVVHNAVRESIKVQAGVSGLNWVRMFYDHMVSLPYPERFFLCTNIMSYAFYKAPFCRALNNSEREIVQKTVGDAKMDWRQFKIQNSVAVLKSVVLPDQISPSSVLQGCIESREFRKTDGSGMSGANQGAYTGEFVSKATRVMRARLSVVATIEIHNELTLMIYTNDTKFIRLLPQVVKVKKWAVVSNTQMSIPGVKIVPLVKTLQHCAALVFIDLNLPTYEPKSGWDKYVASQKIALFNAIQPTMLLAPALMIYPCKVLEFGWTNFNAPTDEKQFGFDGYEATEHLGPTPHNLEYIRVMRRVAEPMALKFKVTTRIQFSNYLQTCNVANSFRNTYFLHRHPINQIFERYKLPYVASFVPGPPPALIALTPSALEQVIHEGYATPEQFMEYYLKFKDEDQLGQDPDGEERSSTSSSSGSDSDDDDHDGSIDESESAHKPPDVPVVMKPNVANVKSFDKLDKVKKKKRRRAIDGDDGDDLPGLSAVDMISTLADDD